MIQGAGYRLAYGSKRLVKEKEKKERNKEQKKGSAMEKYRIYEARFPERFTGFQDPPAPTRYSKT